MYNPYIFCNDSHYYLVFSKEYGQLQKVLDEFQSYGELIQVKDTSLTYEDIQLYNRMISFYKPNQLHMEDIPNVDERIRTSFKYHLATLKKGLKVLTHR